MSVSDLANLFSSPWALHEPVLSALVDIFQGAGSASDQSDGLAASVEKLGAHKKNSQTSRFHATTDDGVASIPITGTIGRSWFAGANVDEIGALVSAAVDDPAVHTIFLDIDSPGGSVAGVPELADQIRAATKTKHVVAFTDGMMASAAYWIGAAADEILATKASEVGSIGVFAALTDLSVMFHQDGVKREIIKHGRNKGAGVPGTPIDADVRQKIQESVDTFGAMFDGDVMAMRGMSADEFSKVNEGRLFIGEKAKAVGLVDEITTFEAARAARNGRQTEMFKIEDVKSAADLEASFPTHVADVRKAATEARDAELEALTPKDVETLAAAYPDLVAKIRENAAGADASTVAAAAVETERKRCKAICEAAFEGQDEAVAKLISEGTAIEDAISDLKAQRAEAIAASGASNAGASEGDDGASASEDGDDFEEQWAKSSELQKRFPKAIGGAKVFAAIKRAELEGRA